MIPYLLQLSDGDLYSLVSALRSGRLEPPFRSVALQRFVLSQLAAPIATELQKYEEGGFTPKQIAATLNLVLQDRARRPMPEDIIDLVTTGPGAGATTNRDTSVVVREFFASAEQSVLIVGYAVYQGQRVFQALADRMVARPKLTVRMFLDIQRNPGNTSSANEIVRHFSNRFQRNEWPPDYPLPELFYFPTSLENTRERRATLHAKCVVVDSRDVFVSSANFTEAAQHRGWLTDSFLHIGRTPCHSL